jgi:hypothetical protein
LAGDLSIVLKLALVHGPTEHPHTRDAANTVIDRVARAVKARYDAQQQLWWTDLLRPTFDAGARCQDVAGTSNQGALYTWFECRDVSAQDVAHSGLSARISTAVELRLSTGTAHTAANQFI